MKDIINYSQLSTSNFLYSLILSYVLGYLLSLVYVKQSRTLSNHNDLARIFPILSTSITIVIAVVKSSLALSLGLVGALSVIRFRTAVKEPFNLAFLLFSICIGISVGASQYLFALFLSIFGTIGFLLAYRSTKYGKSKGFSLETDDIDTIAFTLPYGSSIDQLYELLKKSTLYYSIISIDQVDKEPISLAIKVKVINPASLSVLKKDLFEIFPGSRFSFYNSPSN